MEKQIEIIGARSHNLKNISCTIPRGKLTVITGVSGSGKSTLAFDTLFAEGQRRYVESLSTYARQFLEKMDRPDVEAIHGIPPAIAIEQRNTVKNARSTIGTASEIYDYLRLLYARVGEVICPRCGTPVSGDTVEGTVERLLDRHRGKKLVIVAPVPLGADDDPEKKIQGLIREGYYRAWEAGEVIDLGSLPPGRFLGRPLLPLLIDRIVPDERSRSRLAEAVGRSFEMASGRVEAVGEDGKKEVFSQQFSCDGCGRLFSEPDPLAFSFNSPIGACPACQGFGRIIGIDWEKVIPDPGKTLKERPFVPWNTPTYEELYDPLWKACKKYRIPTGKPFRDLSAEQREIILNGREDFFGIKGFFNWLEERRYKVHYRVFLSKYRAYTPCPTCGGTRLKEEALHVQVGGKSIVALCELSILELQRFFRDLSLVEFKRRMAARLLKEINDRIGFMADAGLGYLTLSRQTRTLSNGEYQRITLARALGSALTETLYVLDEPSIGLHARDTHRLLRALQRLKERGNTVVVVEHDLDIIRQADHVIDLGPGAGRNGGEVVFEGSMDALLQSSGSVTARFLLGGLPSLSAGPPPKSKGAIVIRNAREHNLKGIDVGIPLGQMVCITGVSGAGKTTLVHNILYAGTHAGGSGNGEFERGAFEAIEGLDQIDDILLVDQAPIGKSVRSNPATYVKVFGEIRDLFTRTREARRAGLKPRHFSFNTVGGRCETCQGAGVQVLDMQFLEDVVITCEACGGKRFNPEVLKILLREKSISDVLDMTVEEAQDFFEDHERIRMKLQPLRDVGLGYLSLGQSTNTLSGGESQRLKLALHISQGGRGRNLFIFDEPTTGLHMADVAVLLTTFRKLLARGHSLVVIEHNLDLVRWADYIIDMGPEGGDEGGRIVVEGSVAEVMACKQSHTGRFLRQRFGKP